MNRSVSILAVVCAFVVSASPVAGQTLDVTYIGNTGFVLSAGSQKVVVDAMFDEGWDYYLVPTPSVLDKMKMAEPPFDDVDVILITHWHDDHFDAEIVGEHLRHNQGCTAVMTEQAADLLKKRKDYGKIAHQVIAVAPAWGESVEFRIGDIDVAAVGMKHAPYVVDGVDKHRDVQNVGYVVTVGGVCAYHVGDGYLDVDEGFIESSGIGDRGIDAVFVEYFESSPGCVRVIGEVIRPWAVVATHIPPEELERQAAAFADTYSRAIVFREAMERKTLDIRATGANN